MDWTKDTDCEYVRDGDYHDGGYIYCLNHAKKAVALLNFGVEGRDLFGCELTTRFQIPNYQFDCTWDSAPICQTNNHNNHFSLICLSDQAGDRTKSLKEVIDWLNLTGKHVIIKMDIEGHEFAALESLPEEYFDFIDQITMEIHHYTGKAHRYWENIDVMTRIAKHYVNVNYHLTDFVCFKDKEKSEHFLPSPGVEVTFVNRKLITVNSESRSYEQHPLNHISKPADPDCQLPA
ncbi:unnamed protein product [Sphagnum balticum]